MGVLAVGTGRAETELVANLEVGTGLVDLAVVDDGELVAALFCIQRMGHCWFTHVGVDVGVEVRGSQRVG